MKSYYIIAFVYVITVEVQGYNRNYNSYPQSTGQVIPLSADSSDSREHGNIQHNGNYGSSQKVSDPPKELQFPGNGKDSPTSTVLSTFASPLSSSITDIGLKLMKVIDSSRTTNTVISPLSISLLLALLQQAALGETQSQLTQLFNLSSSQTQGHFSALINLLRKRQSRNIMEIATNIFVDPDYPIDPIFKQLAIQHFASDVEPLNFKYTQKAAKKINEWIASKTNNRITDLVTPDYLITGTQLLLANAIFFKGIWNSTFNPQLTVNMRFNDDSGQFKMAPFMHQAGKYQSGYDNTLQAQYLLKPFEGLQYMMMFIVPAQGLTASQLLQKITEKDISRLLSSPYRDTTISLPKFNIKVETELTQPLIKIGVPELFSSRAVLQGLGSRTSTPRVSGALHGAGLTIDEQGGSAVAATAIAVNTLSLADWIDEFHFKADKPFLLLLWDRETSVPIIMAKINNPLS